MRKSFGEMQTPVWESSEAYDANSANAGSEYLTEMEKKAVQAMRGRYHAE